MIPFPITKQGYAKLEAEIKNLKHVERPKVIELISTAREFGDLSENAEYDAAKAKQGFVEGRIVELEDKLARAQIIDPSKLSTDSVKFGAVVDLIDEDTEEDVSYSIVSEYEADLALKKISIVSPLAKALIGKAVGDIIEVNAPKGTKFYQIVKIRYDEE